MEGTARQYAGLVRRFAALLVDAILFVALFLPATRAVKGVWIMAPTDHRWARGLFVTDPLCIVFLVFIVVYFVLLEELLGATFGKWLLGLRVTPAGSMGKPGLQRSLLRNLMRVVDGLPVLGITGALLILRSPERARFGDRVAGTRVIVSRPGR
jgi:uncharacterized RDD family membrane protein YckC